ncbi:hypothetical protein HYALB_00010863 [Hymenoscyphus albidus]|uniref:Protein artemis n=1 Tax=Hymenoscyphus albidus TaxID=595503 RepID=A0A9N9Q4I2_9HELO|nr:hypothetical protein HYALB_00010863 [Hymenoscyphus albidus]
MSTFRGVMKEFPDVRVDFFRRDPALRPPLACFLSHVHSDHLAGLESFKSPFIYCSAATKEMLLKLERYQHQLNFELGILESRKLQYKHLQNLLKPIPLETPTRIELSPGDEIQVTLFDANHCTGAVMLLFEGENKAVLYTGDIRSEPWFVNNLARNPFLMEYTTGMKTLECVYLDTSNLGPYEFPTKAEGLKELLQKVSKYPADTVFHFSAWTFGYEEVWMTLSRFLNSPIHVSKYNMRLYRSLGGPENNSGSALAPEALYLTGYTVGNTPRHGCLTTDNNVRLHSCRKGTNCPAINDSIVWIQPIVARTKSGAEIAEVGVGGGDGDLSQSPQLDLNNPAVFQKLLQLVSNGEGAADLKLALSTAFRSLTKVLTLDDADFEKGDETSLTDLIKTMTKSPTTKKRASPAPPPASTLPTSADKDGLPKLITFPYSRHSSLPELQDLVRIFKPKDVYPCTVDEVSWHEAISMESLFGSHCSDKIFRHDIEMREIQAEMRIQFDTLATQQTKTTEKSQLSSYGDSTPTPVTPSPNKPAVQSSRPEDSVTSLDGRPPGARRTLSGTPPTGTLFDSSPGGNSQSLRRKAVGDGFDPEDRSKRPRLSPSSVNSTLLPRSNNGPAAILADNKESAIAQTTVGLSSKANTQPVLVEQKIHSKHAEQDVNEMLQNSSSSLGSVHPSSESDSGSDSESGIPHTYESGSLYFGLEWDSYGTWNDRVDRVVRCGRCSHEYWGKYAGCCTNCSPLKVRGQLSDEEIEVLPYVEVQKPHTELNEDGYRPLPTYEINPDMRDPYGEETLISHQDICEPYLDCGSSAYDSQDDDPDFQQQYEINSFIDDDEPESESEDEDVHDDEIDYKEKFLKAEEDHRALQQSHLALRNRHAALTADFEGLRRDILGSEFDSEDMLEYAEDLEGGLEDGLLVVDVPPPDPLLAEVVLTDSGAEDTSNDSLMGELRELERVNDEQSAAGAGVGSSVHGGEYGMVTPENNHTVMEDEL